MISFLRKHRWKKRKLKTTAVDETRMNRYHSLSKCFSKFSNLIFRNDSWILYRNNSIIMVFRKCFIAFVSCAKLYSFDSPNDFICLFLSVSLFLKINLEMMSNCQKIEVCLNKHQESSFLYHKSFIISY